jgi:tRNA nucleotidyltransferase (CCA-adding enzyme)
MQADGAQLLHALSAQPGGPELLKLGEGRADLMLVGGAVRDLLLGRSPRELDVVVAEDAHELAGELAVSLDAQAQITAHERFGTAVLDWEGGRVDVAQRRAESYATPGALPQVRPGDVHEDLARRDFTVNAIALGLGGAQLGHVLCVEHALADLEARRLRVLHERSFQDDPTRLLRLARYRARLQFAPEPYTAELASRAIAAGALGTVTPARVGAELRLALEEADAISALEALRELGLLQALQPGLSFDAELARRALELLPADGRPDLLLLACALTPLADGAPRQAEETIYELLDRLEFTAGDRERVLRSTLAAGALAARLRKTHQPSQLHELLHPHTVEAVALAGAIGHAAGAAGEWLERLRHARLEIDGNDLLAAGVPSGPEVGARLAAALSLKLDGKLADGRQAELRAALEAAP